MDNVTDAMVEVTRAIDRSIARMQALTDYASRPFWDAVVREELEGLFATLQAENAALKARVKVLGEAIKPFARHLDEMQFDLDNNGNTLPDGDTVGWVYLTNGDFRRARQALTQTGDA